ncbi:MAG TPA: ABC transporter substrate-binding protein [Stellaceae bacterium]|jgi:putative ABC transport system substrate-binding protein|nr:ABC transporter substrate-binding protein [Stellaceae bacterium]
MRRCVLLLVAAGALLSPIAVDAQQPGQPLVGFLHGSAPVGQYQTYVGRFLAGLKEEGFAPENNLAVQYRWAEGQYDRVPVLAADLLSLHPSVVVVYGPPNVVRAAIDALPPALPIVFGTGGDPVAAGIVRNLGRPPGNVTGTANRTNALDTKRLELLRDLLPESAAFGLILNPNNSDAQEVIKAAQAGAATLGRGLVVATATMPEQLDAAFAAVVEQGARGLLMGSDTFLNAQRDRILALAARHRLPTIYNGRQFVESGGLVSYGADFADTYRLIGTYAGKILKGAKPADLPVIEPTRFELVINLKTAKTLGLTIPQMILVRADEVIE